MPPAALELAPPGGRSRAAVCGGIRRPGFARAFQAYNCLIVRERRVAKSHVDAGPVWHILPVFARQ